LINLKGPERATYVQDMFGRIARRYDLMNRLMTVGQDVVWRRKVIRKTELPKHSILLDLGSGTGDLAFEAHIQYPDCIPVAADFALTMMRVGQHKPGHEKICWNGTDALHLPYPKDTFDAVVSGFLLRNVIDIRRSLEEQYRVLKQEGKLVALDTTRIRKSVIRPLIHFYMHKIIPFLGNILTRERDAYIYLPESSDAFLFAEELAALLVEVGFREVGFQRLMFGAVSIHWGVK